jgi:hypothetical protein
MSPQTKYEPITSCPLSSSKIYEILSYLSKVHKVELAGQYDRPESRERLNSEIVSRPDLESLEKIGYVNCMPAYTAQQCSDYMNLCNTWAVSAIGEEFMKIYPILLHDKLTTGNVEAISPNSLRH